MKIRLALLGIFFLASQGATTTWTDIEVVCPVCNTTNSFQAPMSYGSYIYEWPSKFQYIFWPDTTNVSLYSCKSCQLTCFMGDFDQIPKDKICLIRQSLPTPDLNRKTVEYFDIPMGSRLRIAEKVYSVLGRDDYFWCWFYRTMGYHLVREDKSEEARESRKKALSFVSKLLESQKKQGQKKEFCLISGALRYFLDDVDGAKMDFQEALKLTYKNENFSVEDSKNTDEYLTDLLNDYMKKIKTGEKIPEE